MSGLSRAAVGLATVGRVCTRQSRMLAASSHCINANRAMAHQPSDHEKKKLVMAKMYHHVDDVPDSVSETKMKTGKDWYRVQMTTMMIVIFTVGAGFYIYLGHKDRDSGKNLIQMGKQFEADQHEIGLKQQQIHQK